MLKRFLLIAVLLLSCGVLSAKTLIMATNAEFAPYEYREGGKIVGIDPDIVRIIAKNLGYELKIEDMKFDSVIASVQSGKADIGASGLTITEERKKQVLFSIPYIVAEQLIIVPQGSPIRTKADLKGKRVGAQHGTTGAQYLEDHFQAPQRFDNGALAVSALLAGKLDAVVIDSEPAKVFVKQNSGLIILNAPLTSEEYAFAFNKKDTELCRQFNEELRKMMLAPLDQIIAKYKEKTQVLAAVQPETEADVANQTFWTRIKDSFYLNFVEDNRYQYLLKGFGVTLLITFFAVVIGTVIGFLVAIVRSTAEQTRKMGWLLKILDAFCKVYLTVIRGTPVVVQLLIIYFVIFGAVDVNKILVAIIAFGINSGAYVAEIFRAGIMSIDRGQLEAGRSLGLSYTQTMRSIIVPQAFKNVLPALGNELIVLLKETSIAGYIALVDLTKGGDIIRSQTYDAFMPLIAVALIYLAVVMLLSYLLKRLERSLKINE